MRPEAKGGCSSGSRAVDRLLRPQWLDGTKISRSERIRACQRAGELKGRLREQEEEHVRRRRREKEEARTKEGKRGVTSAA